MCGSVGSIIAKGGSNVNPCVKPKLKRPLLGCRGGRCLPQTARLTTTATVAGSRKSNTPLRIKGTKRLQAASALLPTPWDTHRPAQTLVSLGREPVTMTAVEPPRRPSAH